VKKLLMFLTPFCLVVGAFGYFWTMNTQSYRPLTEPVVAKFVAVSTTAGKGTVSSDLLVFRNSEGVIATIVDLGYGETSRTVFTRKSNSRTISGTGAKTTIYLKEPVHFPLFDPVVTGATCRPYKLIPQNTLKELGEGTFLGYKVFKYQVYGSDGKPQYETWHAPELGCMTVYMKDGLDQAEKGCAQEQMLVSILFEEPDPALFNVDGLDEVTPSEMSARFRLKHNIPLAGDTAATRKADEWYAKAMVFK
jgi:hypothetical protein